MYALGCGSGSWLLIDCIDVKLVLEVVAQCINHAFQLAGLEWYVV